VLALAAGFEGHAADLEIDGVKRDGGDPAEAAEAEGGAGVHALAGEIDAEVEADVPDVDGPVAGGAEGFLGVKWRDDEEE
jgi:hypothetical protein